MFILKYKHLKRFVTQNIIFRYSFKTLYGEVQYILAYSTILSLDNYKWYFCV